MKLIKNVDGDWTDSKQRIRQDLDTIQRNINQILAQINAPTDATPADPAVISSANTVTVPTTDFLSVVAHDSTLTGEGTTTNPLKTASSGVTVDAAGALSGVGTVASPLAVKVDGSTISIVGDVLQAIVTQAVFLNTGSLNNTLPPNSTNVPFAARTQIGTVAAVPGKTIWPLVICMSGGQTLSGGTVGGWSPAVAWDVVWNGISGSIITGSRQIFVSGGSSQFTELIPFTSTEISTTTLNAFRNAALIVRTNNGASTLGSTDSSTTMTNTANYTLLYVLL